MKQYVITIYVATEKELTKELVHKVKFDSFDDDITDISVEELDNFQVK